MRRARAAASSRRPTSHSTYRSALRATSCARCRSRPRPRSLVFDPLVRADELAGREDVARDRLDEFGAPHRARQPGIERVDAETIVMLAVRRTPTLVVGRAGRAFG